MNFKLSTEECPHELHTASTGLFPSTGRGLHAVRCGTLLLDQRDLDAARVRARPVVFALHHGRAATRALATFLMPAKHPQVIPPTTRAR